MEGLLRVTYREGAPRSRTTGWHHSLLLAGILAAASVLGCSGGQPVTEPPDIIGVAGTADATPISEPMELRYRWDEEDVLTYRVTSGDVDPEDGTVTGRRLTYSLSLSPIPGRDAARAECRRRMGSEAIASGLIFEVEEEQESWSSAEVDTQGRVLKLLHVESDEIAAGDDFLHSGANIYGNMVVGFLAGELALGVMHACPLPDTPVAAGDAWATEVEIPSLDATPTAAEVRYEGKLIRLEQVGDAVYGTIETSILPPGMDTPYVAQTQFDVTHGRIVRAKWTALPGASGEHPTRWVELMD